MPTDLLETDLKLECVECGRECGEGFVERGTGQRDPETGYQDLEIICSLCNAIEHGLCESCCREEGTCVVDDQRLCSSCADDADMPEDMSEGWDGE